MAQNKTCPFERRTSAERRRAELFEQLRDAVAAIDAIDRHLAQLATECSEEPTQRKIDLAETLAGGMS